MSVQAATRGVPVTLHSGATTGNGIAIAIPSSFKNHKIIISGIGDTVSAGAVQPEEASSHDYAGVWSPIGGSPISIPLSGAAQVVEEFTGVYQFIRCRISTTVE